jgi:hypothetical protein
MLQAVPTDAIPWLERDEAKPLLTPESKQRALEVVIEELRRLGFAEDHPAVVEAKRALESLANGRTDPEREPEPVPEPAR